MYLNTVLEELQSCFWMLPVVAYVPREIYILFHSISGSPIMSTSFTCIQVASISCPCIISRPQGGQVVDRVNGAHVPELTKKTALHSQTPLPPPQPPASDQTTKEVRVT